MKLQAVVFSGVLVLLATTTFSQAFAAQMTTFLVPELDKSQVTYTGVRLLTLQYPAGSDIANQLQGRKEVTFTVNGTATDDSSGMAQIIKTVEQVLVSQKKSPVQISDAKIVYTARIVGRADEAQVSYKVDFIPTIENFVLQAGQNGQPDIIDLDWRGIVIKDPMVVNTEQYGKVDINHPSSLFQILYPDIGQKLENSGAKEIMDDPIMAFDDFAVPMGTWHYLFDPTGSQASAAGYYTAQSGARVVSVYSLGESSIREGTHLAKEKDTTVSIDGADVKIHAQTPPPSGQLQIAGFAKIQESSGTEVALVTKDAPAGAVTATGGFPIQVLLAFGGMMGAIAIFVLIKARK